MSDRLKSLMHIIYIVSMSRFFCSHLFSRIYECAHAHSFEKKIISGKKKKNDYSFLQTAHLR